ncbi:MAG: GlsB/YeaQ/YmgE family stress response membrane protein [Ignavibacteriae bacterium]|nr:GlsB/YeaQ/YmgE family stress response membrane protein [Ignavibacteriota bacterium]
MGLIGTILIGLVAGALAKLIMPGKQGGGWIMTILLGIAGSLVATMLGRAVGWYQEGEGAQFIGSIVGAIIILIVYGFFKKKSA